MNFAVYYFASLLKPLLRARFFSGLYGLLIMSSISCCVFLCLFVLLYDIGIKFVWGRQLKLTNHSSWLPNKYL